MATGLPRGPFESLRVSDRSFVKIWLGCSDGFCLLGNVTCGMLRDMPDSDPSGGFIPSGVVRSLESSALSSSVFHPLRAQLQAGFTQTCWSAAQPLGVPAGSR